MKYVAAILGFLGLIVSGKGSTSEISVVQVADPIRFEITGDAGRWYVIDWGMKGCPEILRDGATYVVAIAGQARACTSTRRPTGLSLTSYTVSIGGQRSALPFEGNESERLIWGMATRELMRPEGALREVFFYGTAVQLTPDKWAEQARILAQ